jgi:lipopolysaccharide transport system permease protein
MEEILIEPGRGFKHYWRDIWRFRELFYILAWRDILVRYKQTVIGIVWALIRPLLTMIVFSIVFNKVAKLEAPGSIPYPLLVFAAMLPWQFFSTALSESSNSLVANANLISKVYFPRMIVPAGSVITSLVDFLITLGLMALMMIWYGFVPDWRLITLPVFTALAFGAAFGAGLWLCALNVKYRDFRYVIPFVVQFGLYISPVGFTSDNIPQQWRLLFSLNPMVGVIDGFRWALLGGEMELWWPSLMASVLVASVLCLSGIWYFRRVERTFADVI